mmetsp:Transcript_7599/g.14422  ORF Transcript_7599/g.14422 Transcript_7599/m.14422 type:complete len:225 (+) Transcript_7599:98-772(+)
MQQLFPLFFLNSFLLHGHKGKIRLIEHTIVHRTVACSKLHIDGIDSWLQNLGFTGGCDCPGAAIIILEIGICRGNSLGNFLPINKDRHDFNTFVSCTFAQTTHHSRQFDGFFQRKHNQGRAGLGITIEVATVFVIAFFDVISDGTTIVLDRPRIVTQNTAKGRRLLHPRYIEFEEGWWTKEGRSRANIMIEALAALAALATAFAHALLFALLHALATLTLGGSR